MKNPTQNKLVICSFVNLPPSYSRYDFFSFTASKSAVSITRKSATPITGGNIIFKMIVYQQRFFTQSKKKSES